jgi:nucleoside-diphosphate-sugar epimerase
MIFLTGVTSSTGALLARELMKNGERVLCILRSPVKTEFLPRGIEIIYGNIEKLFQFKAELRECSIFVNAAHIRFSRYIIPICEEIGLKRVIFLSSTRRYSAVEDPTVHQVIEAESLIHKSNLEYTILRPSMIFGGKFDNNISHLISVIKWFRCFPLIKSGKNLVQPIFVLDVVKTIISILNNKISIRKKYTICGPAAITYHEMVKTVAEEIGAKVLFFPAPLILINILLMLAELFRLKLPFTRQQLLRLSEDKAFDFGMAKKELGFEPTVFRDAVRLKLNNQI